MDRVGVEPTFRGGFRSHTPQCYLPILWRFLRGPPPRRNLEPYEDYWWPGVESSHPLQTENMVGREGVEPSSCGFSDHRSDRLSYRPLDIIIIRNSV